MRFLLVLCLFLTVYAPSAQAHWLEFFRAPQTKLYSHALPMVQRRAIVGSYSLKVNHVMMLNRLNLPAVRLPALKAATVSYYKTVALRFPDVAVKPMNEAKNTMEDLLLSLPASLKPENVLIERIPNIEKPTEAYLAALFADTWDNWLKSGIGLQPPAEMAVSKADMKTAQALQEDLSANFVRQYEALPQEQKDLRAQLSRVMGHVQAQTGWDDETLAVMEDYFMGVMRPMLNNQENLTALEFLQAYDVLTVVAEIGERYQRRVAKGAAALPEFVISESIQRVRRDLTEGFVPAEGSARSLRLQKWYNGLFGKEQF